MAVEHGLHVLLETPIAHKLAEADAIIAAARERGVKIEVTHPLERCSTFTATIEPERYNALTPHPRQCDMPWPWLRTKKKNRSARRS